MILLSVDVGNTRTKVGVFQDTELQQVDIFPTEELKRIPKKYDYAYAIISSVSNLPAPATLKFGEKRLLLLNHQTPLPFENKYKTPKTLGADRVAAVAGAFSLFPQKNALVIDLGSCITYDFIDDAGVYHGGSIAPGLQMRLQAMHTFTAKLPLVNINNQNIDTPLIGNSTETALLSGAVNGIIAEITQMIRMYTDKFADLQIVICGGNATLLANEIPMKISVMPELVLIGLNSILRYHLPHLDEWESTLH